MGPEHLIESYLPRLVVDNGVEEGENGYLQVGRVLRLVQAARQVHDQGLHGYNFHVYTPICTHVMYVTFFCFCLIARISIKITFLLRMRKNLVTFDHYIIPR